MRKQANELTGTIATMERTSALLQRLTDSTKHTIGVTREMMVTVNEVRDNLKDAFYAARDIYDELFGGRGRLAVAQRVATDSEIHEKLLLRVTA